MANIVQIIIFWIFTQLRCFSRRILSVSKNWALRIVSVQSSVVCQHKVNVGVALTSLEGCLGSLIGSLLLFSYLQIAQTKLISFRASCWDISRSTSHKILNFIVILTVDFKRCSVIDQRIVWNTPRSRRSDCLAWARLLTLVNLILEKTIKMVKVLEARLRRVLVGIQSIVASFRSETFRSVSAFFKIRGLKLLGNLWSEDFVAEANIILLTGLCSCNVLLPLLHKLQASLSYRLLGSFTGNALTWMLFVQLIETLSI